MKRTLGSILLLLLGFVQPAFAVRYGVFAHFASGGGWSSELFFTNQGLSAISVTLSFYDESGASLGVETNIGTGAILGFTLSAGTTQVIKITPPSSLVVGSIVATYPSGAPVRATEVFRYEQSNVVSAEVGVSQLIGGQHFSFPVEINSSLGVFTAVAMANPSFIGMEQTVIANLVKLDGTIQKTVTVPLKRGEHFSRYLHEQGLFQGVDNFTGSVSISSPEGLVVLALRQDKQAWGAISTDSGPILGPFAVTKTSFSESEPNNTDAQAQLLSGTALITGTSGTQLDMDAFAFTGKRGDIVSVICDTQGLNSSMDPTVFISDSNLNEIAWNDENGLYGQGDSFIQAVLPADGKYYIVLFDYFAGYGASYTYRLHITLPSTGTQ